jgi:ATP-dependent DNA ligase
MADALPVVPPVAPMLARLARELPAGEGWLFEPKWDGFRCLVFRDGDEVDLRSRNDRPLARYFSELVAGVRALSEPRVVLDGEVLVLADGRADFTALMARLHPAASRAERLAAATPARFVAFDLLALGDGDLRDAGFAERRAALETVLRDVPRPLHLTVATDDRCTAARWLEQAAGGGLDGVIAKPVDLPYLSGKRAMVKVKPERTADCVVAGCRLFRDPTAVASLLLGLYDAGGALRHVGVVSAFAEQRRQELVAELAPLAVPLEGHPWEHGFGTEAGGVGRLGGAATRWTPDLPLDWLPLRLQVCEVAYDHVEAGRFRHPARFRRWRPDRDPRSCDFDQLALPADVSDLLRP